MAAQRKTSSGKDELVRAFAEKAQTTLVDAGKYVGAFIEVLVKILETGDLHLIGFGAFRRVSRPEHQGRNPKTGETITVPASSTVRFKPSAAPSHTAQKSGGRRAQPDRRSKRNRARSRLPGSVNRNG